ncbi:YjgF-like protein [Meredithblackwellia eburnea MCA 4105]
MAAINSPSLPAPPPFLSQAILVQEPGQTLYLSGQCGTDPTSGEFIPGTVQDRTTQIFKNAEFVLKEAGMGLEHVVAVTIYLSKYTEDFLPMNEAYIAAFKPTGKPLPSRTCIGVAALPKGTDVEITMVARK